ncbi:ogr/Delta-like zinc finger family protein [Novosphingobium colocasiae]|uniref:Zinc finger Ogr/Delta-type domain-containing protein n=1 Tax=Novosphingobium colocasiae TaxID=1256513 RepID=A0A918UFP3_9SPHN|nr:ogr/Delta-like zinc finger family protein [Novosphingobium colocasiae]GGZ02532.1 hypothetical protein GCM10011614_17000 [Novosphingobium colocasiae]
MSGEGHLAARPLIEAPLEFRLRSGGMQTGDSAFVLCPICDAPAYIRKSTRVTPTVKELIAHCTNSGCGHTFMSQVVYIHTYNPGILQRPGFDLVLCPRDRVPHVLPPRAAPDDDPDQMSMFAASG